MSYRNLSDCVKDLAKNRHLVRIDDLEIDPFLELAAVQRRAFRNGSPALLFTRVKGCSFPMMANLYGTRERMRFIFRKSLGQVERLLAVKADPTAVLRHPLSYLGLSRTMLRMLPRKVRGGPVLARRSSLSQLPKLVSWPMDGGPYVTLPQVYTEQPGKPGFFASNLGTYRVRLGGND